MTRIRDRIDEYRAKCIECGQCREVCPSYRHGGCDPLAVMLGDDKAVFDCVGCGECSRICPETDPKTVMLAAYSIVTGMEVSECFRETGLARPLREEASRTELPPGWTGDDVYVMPGCIVRCWNPHLEHSVPSAFGSFGVRCTEVPVFSCCMYPIQFGCMEDEDRDGYRTRMGDSTGGKPLVTMCAGCSEIMQRSGVGCEHMIVFLHRHLGELPRLDRKIRVSMEPGCSAKPFTEEMREVLEAMGCEVVNRTQGCCGKASRKVATALMSERQEAAEDADVIVVGCPMCYEKYDSFPGGKPVLYISELVALASGDDSTLKFHRIPVDLF